MAEFEPQVPNLAMAVQLLINYLINIYFHSPDSVPVHSGITIPGTIPLSIQEWLHSTGICYPRNGNIGRAPCQILFLRNPQESTGIPGFLQESVGHHKDLCN